MSLIMFRAALGFLAVGFLTTGLARAEDKKIYWTEAGSDKIRRADLDGSNIEDVIPDTAGDVQMLAVRQSRRQLYWVNSLAGANAGTIKRATLWGEQQQELVTRIGGLTGIAVDGAAEKMYWTNQGSDFGGVTTKIERANLDGSGVETLVSTIPNAGRRPYGIALDHSGQKMYWADSGDSPSFPGGIRRANLDGSNVEQIVPTGSFGPIGLALDSTAGKVYWADVDTGGIHRASLDGSGIEELVSDAGQPTGITLDLDTGKMYWVDSTNGKIQRANLDGTFLEDVIPDGLDIPFDLVLVSTVAANNIPAVSFLGLVVLGTGVIVGAIFLLRRHAYGKQSPNSSKAIVIVGLLPAWYAPSPVVGQPATGPVEIHSVSLDSGQVSAAFSGAQPRAVFSHRMRVPGASSLRLHFDVVELAGSEIMGNASYVRIIALLDGQIQVLSARTLPEWRNSSAYFNGDEVRVELVAFPGTGSNRLVSNSVAAELQGGEGCLLAFAVGGFCDGTDDRIPSSDPRQARFRYFIDRQPPCGQIGWCTAFLLEGRPNWLLTAGHCCDFADFDNQCSFAPVVEFNVPLSSQDGSIVHAAVDDQYAVDPASVQWEALQLLTDGKDWCLFGVFNNPNTGETPLESQAASFRLASGPSAPDDSTLRVTGYGLDDQPLQSCGAQQTSTGAYAGPSSSQLFFRVDIALGNSGAPVEHECRGLVYGLVEAAGCAEPLIGANQGTPVSHSVLRDALTPNEIDGGTREPIGVCADCNRNGIHDDLDLAPGGGSDDCNANGIPDECDFEEDCQPNSVQDICDIAAGTSRDLDGNQIPDECEGPVGACCTTSSTC